MYHSHLCKKFDHLPQVSTTIVGHTVMKLPFKFLCQKVLKLMTILLILYLIIDIGKWMLSQKNNTHKVTKNKVKEKVNKTLQAISPPLILVWNGYQEDDSLYRTIFKRMTSGSCRHTCSYTRNKSRQNESAAILFHLPNLHWEGYNYPTYRNPAVPWVLMTYESANSVRERASNWGRALTGTHIDNVFNRTMTLRADSDIVVRHGQVEKREAALTEEEVKSVYSQDTVRDFSNHTQEHFQPGKQSSPVVWFVSHCKDYDGRMIAVHRGGHIR